MESVPTAVRTRQQTVQPQPPPEYREGNDLITTPRVWQIPYRLSQSSLSSWIEVIGVPQRHTTKSFT